MGIIEDFASDKREIRDQLNNEPKTVAVIKKWEQNIYTEELTTKLVSHFIGTCFTLGANPNGILGTAGGRLARIPEVVAVKYLRAVVNPLDRFKDYFRNTAFVGTSTTAILNINEFQIEF